MRTHVRMGSALLIVLMAAAASAEELSEVEYYRQQALQYQLAQAECEEPSSGAFVVMPQYFNSRNDRARGKMGGTRTRLDKGRANGFGITAGLNKDFSEVFSLGVMYQYAFMGVRGGFAYPAAGPAADAARERSRWDSHVVGLLPKFNLGEFGRLSLSAAQGFDRAGGSESIYAAGVRERRDIDDYGANVTSLMAWYEKDFGLGCDTGWKLSPYAGWRSQYVHVRNQNDWNAAAGVRSNDNFWMHHVSGGMKLSYDCGPFGLSVRGGVNYRTTRNDVAMYGTRAVAPGVIQYSHRANFDRTVGTVGAKLSYAAHKRLVVSVGYDGFFGSDTSAHTGSLVFGIPF